jgi:hypothetical protein
VITAELSYTQEQKLKQGVARFKFNLKLIERAAADTTVGEPESGFSKLYVSKTNANMDAFHEHNFDLIIEKVLKRKWTPDTPVPESLRVRTGTKDRFYPDADLYDPLWEAAWAAIEEPLWDRWMRTVQAAVDKRMAS